MAPHLIDKDMNSQIWHWLIFTLITVVSCGLMACSAGKIKPLERSLKLELAPGEEISAITFIYNQRHRGLNGFAVALGDGGSAIYNMDGSEIWREKLPARLVTYDGRALLIFRTHEEQTILDRYHVSDLTYIGFLDRQMPSEIAATTLQRTSYSSLGALTLSNNAVRMPIGRSKDYLAYTSKHQVAAIASTSKPMPYFPEGVVAMASIDGHIEFMSEADFKSRLK